MAVAVHQYSYLSRLQAEFRDCADAYLLLNGTKFLVHTQLLSYKSPLLAHLFAISLPAAVSTCCGTAPLPVVCIPAGALPFELHEDDFELFLRHMYEPAAVTKVGEAEVLLKLADYFQTEEVTARCEAWMCSSLHSISDSKGLEDLACTAFELAVKYRLSRATALLLPWALQRLSHGGRQGVVWYDAHRRLLRLQEAMTPELKSLSMEAFWWAQSGVQRCALCGCCPDDLKPAFDFATRRPWRSCWDAPAPHHHRQQLPPPPQQQPQPQHYPHHYHSAAAPLGGGSELLSGSCPAFQHAVSHFAHLLKESNWGN